MKKKSNFILKTKHIWIPFFHSGFFNLSFCWPTTDFWVLVKRTGSIVQSLLFWCYLNLKIKKELHEEVKFQWSALRVFNWQHFNSYMIPQHTDLFCHTIIFAKFKMLTSFNPSELPFKYWGSIYAHITFQ